jgi:hypothetical protein
LVHIAKIKNKTKIHRGADNTLKKVYDIDLCALLMIKDFFDGRLGKIFMDEEALFNEDKGLELDKFV